MYTSKARLICRSLGSFYTVKPNLEKKKYNLAKQLYTKIKTGGPITIADYMKEVLVNPFGGYYMHKDVFGESGDFVTSPELGQIFGEMVAIWFLNEWSKVGAPKPLQIVELGPGRGTLCQDMLRVFNHFQSLNNLSVNLVEVSPYLSDSQARRLCIQSNVIDDPNSTVTREGKTINGVPIKWYKDLKDVPKSFTLLVAHEFFDALPVHKLQKTPDGYREILIDIDENKENAFRYVMSRQETPATKLYMNENETRDHVEISPQSLILAKEIATRLDEDGGMALIADYGHEGESKDTFRAYKKHKQHDPLVEPGHADLTADVDFQALKNAATEGGNVLAFGPVSQRDFLLRMGIEHRVKKLEEVASQEQIKSLKFGYDMMIDADKMGSRFKFMALLPSVLDKILAKVPVVGFN